MLGDTTSDTQTSIDNASGFFPGESGGMPTGTAGGNFWSSPAWSAIGTALNNAAGILGTRYAVPQLNPGQMIQSGPYGTTMYQGGANSMYPSIPSVGGMGGGTLLLLGGGAILLVMMMNKGKSN